MRDFAAELDFATTTALDLSVAHPNRPATVYAVLRDPDPLHRYLGHLIGYGVRCEPPTLRTLDGYTYSPVVSFQAGKRVV